MSLQGKLIALDNGRLAFQCESTAYNTPELIRHTWQLDSFRTRGMSYCTVEQAIGRPATCTDGRISCYLGNGNYLDGTLPNGGSSKAISVDVIPVPCPKGVRGETRWQSGRWEKYTKTRGWIAA